MKWGVGVLVAILLLALILGGSACGTYNTLTTKRNAVQTSFSNVDTQLQRRADLIPNLPRPAPGCSTRKRLTRKRRPMIR